MFNNDIKSIIFNSKSTGNLSESKQNDIAVDEKQTVSHLLQALDLNVKEDKLLELSRNINNLPLSKCKCVIDKVCSILSVTKNKNALINLFLAINQRLNLMFEVAHYKYIKKKDIEDLEQEKKVLANAAVVAKSHAISVAEFTTFTQTQMDIAKKIQFRLFSNWEQGILELPLTCTDLNEIRKEIMTLNGTIISLIKQHLTEHGCFSEEDLQLSLIIRSTYLLEDEKSLLLEALKLIKLSID